MRFGCVKYLTFAAVLLLLTGCSVKVIDTEQMHRATMKTYTVGGVIYQPQNVIKGQTEVGIASWYGPDFHGRLTSNGEKYDMHSLTAAHKTMPMNTIVEVLNLENGKKAEVRINDRGPFVSGRIIDLSKAAAKKLDVHKYGTARVRLTVVGFYSANAKNAEPNIVRVKGGEKLLTQSSVQTYTQRKTADETHIYALQNSASHEAKNLSNSNLTQTSEQNAIDKPITIAQNPAVSALQNIQATPVETSVAQKAVVNSKFGVQVGSFRDEGSARAHQKRFNSFSTAIKRYSGDLYRVFVTFESESAARQFVASGRVNGAFLSRDF